MTNSTRIDRLLFTEARKAAQLSTMPIKMGAIVARGNRVIKIGYNKPGRSRTLGAWSQHAEIDATININAEKAQVYIYREHGLLHSPLLARPCDSFCTGWLEFIGIEEAVYTIPAYPYFERMKF